MAVDLSVKLGIDGADEYSKKIENITAKTKDLNAQLKAGATEFDKYGRAQATNRQKVETLTQKIELQKQKVSEAETMLGKIKEQYGEDSTAAHNYSAKVSDLTTELNRMNEELKEAGGTPLGASLKDVGGKMQKIGEVGEKIGKGLTTYVTAPLVGVGTMAVASFAEVDKTMTLTNKTMGNTADEAELLNQAMKDAASKSTYGMKDAATATLNFARAGLDAQQAAAALAPAMNLAAGEGGDLETVSAGLVATINGFGDSFDQTSHYADVFAAACNNSALDVDSLSSSMSVAAPVFSAAGYGVEDAALYMGIMANNGIEASVAANSLKTGFARLVSPAKEGAEMMDQLGISVTNADGSMKDSVTIQNELHDAFAGLSESEQIAAASAIFGKNQMAPWLALINTAPGDVDDLSDSLGDCAGTTDEMAEAMMGGFGGSIEQLKSSLDVLITSLGEALAPTIQKVVGFVQNLTTKFNKLSPAQQKLIAKIGMIAAAAGPVILVISKITSGVGGLLTRLPTLIPIISKVVAAVTGPVGIIVAAIAGISAVLITLWNTNEDFRNKVIEIWNGIKDFALGIWDGIKSIFGGDISVGGILTGAWDAITGVAGSIFSAVKGVFTGEISVGELLTSAWDTVTSTASSLFDTAKGYLTGEISLPSVVTDAWNTLSETAGTIWESAKSVFSDTFPEAAAVAATAWSSLKDTAGLIWEAAKGVFGETAPAVAAILTDAWGTLFETASNLWETVKGVFTGEVSVSEVVATAWDSLETYASTVWETAKGVFETVAPAVKTVVATAWSSLPDTAGALWDTAKAVFETVAPAAAAVVTDAWDTLTETAGNIWDTAKAVFADVAPEAAAVITTAWDTLSEAAGTAWDTAKAVFADVAPQAAAVVTTAWDTLSETASTIWTSVGDVFSSFDITWPDFGQLASSAFEGLKTAASDAWNWICGLFGGGGEDSKELKTGEVDISTVTGATQEMVDAVGNAKLVISAVDTTALITANSYVATQVSNMEKYFSNSKPKIPTVNSDTVRMVMTAVSTACKNMVKSFSDMKPKVPGVKTDTVRMAMTAVSTACKNMTTTFSNMKLKIPSVGTTALSSAYSTVKSKIAEIKNLMNFSWKLPTIRVPALPHISPSFTGSKSPDGKVTAYGVNYHTSWYDKGGVFYDPAIIGIAERRPEFVGALDDLKDVVRSAMNEGGGRTFVQNNYSPKALSRLEIYRQTKNFANFALLG